MRASNDGEEVATDPLRDVESTSTSVLSSEASVRNPTKEWTSYKRLLMQRFPVSKMVSISSVSVLCVILFGFFLIMLSLFG